MLRTVGAVVCGAALALVVSLHTELQCGRLRGGALALTFPAAAQLPRTMHASAIAVQGRRPSSVKLANRTLSIAMSRPTSVRCNVIAPGTVKILVTRAAQLGNPAAAGAYKLAVHYGTETLEATLTIAS